MTSTPLSKKKLNEYTLEDLKYFFYGLMRKVSSKVILIEIGNEFFNIAIASYKNHKLSIRKVFRQNLPKEALDKSIPTDSEAFSALLKTCDMIDLPLILSNGFPGNLVADILEGMIISVFIDYLYLFRL